MASTFIIDRDAERRACQRAAIDTAGFRLQDAREVLACGMDFLSLAKDRGLGGAFLTEFARSLHDELSNMWAAHDRILDDAGLVPLAALDLSELETLIAGDAA